ncbi:MAG TPA: helix-turn-helix domain-containing protein [Candidatus Ruania gallistercoris]|uniref:Helix-turn-helix domain-containing protein n=1 Tax=Candidatus Ruania gallistercoris TaxID=2838746 RepID=A0A9D2EAH7_9MICO|nr:helix-turn-helix domain-containing protein [Candidatus Ruania gallistercoris]
MRLTDARAMRAMAHPLRIELFERLAILGTATASDLAPLVGSTPSNCSFHLRTLAEAGFIERVPGHTGRQRPWQVLDIRQSWETPTDDDSDLAGAATALESSFREWEFERIRQAAARTNPPDWHGALHTTGATLFLTPAEARDVAQRIAEIVDDYTQRWDHPDQRPPEGRPVRLYTTTYLVQAAGEADTDTDMDVDTNDGSTGAGKGAPS